MDNKLVDESSFAAIIPLINEMSDIENGIYLDISIPENMELDFEKIKAIFSNGTLNINRIIPPIQLYPLGPFVNESNSFTRDFSGEIYGEAASYIKELFLKYYSTENAYRHDEPKALPSQNQHR